MAGNEVVESLDDWLAHVSEYYQLFFLPEVKDCGVVAEVQVWLVANSYTSCQPRAFHVPSLILASSPPVIYVSHSEPLNPRSRQRQGS